MKELSRRVKRQGQFIFRVSEAARRLGVSDTHIINLIEGGELEAIDISSRRGKRANWRIPREALERFQSRNSSMTTGGGTK